jgi:2-iminobutanoate/2-iminopropanoate deaminase
MGDPEVRRLTLKEGANPPAGPYAHVVISGGFAFVSGQGGVDPSTGTLAGGGIRGQTRQAILNLETILGAAGSGLGEVVKVTAFLADMGDYAGFNGAYGEAFPDGFPARTTVQARLPREGMLVEIDAIARVKE